MPIDDDSYPGVIDGAPAAISANLRLEHAASATHDMRYTIAIALRDAGERGLGTEVEVAELAVIEQALLTRANALGLLYAGRLCARGVWEITFYGPRGRLEALRVRALERAGDRRVAAIMNPEPAWTYYRELLLPDARQRQWLHDRRMVELLLDRGDPLATPRRVDHHLELPDAAACDAFVVEVARAGFAGEIHGLAVVVHRVDRVELDHIHEVAMLLVAAAAPLGGRYDRWESCAIG